LIYQDQCAYTKRWVHVFKYPIGRFLLFSGCIMFLNWQKINCGKIHIKFTILIICKSTIQFSSVKCIHIVVHQFTELFHLAKLKLSTYWTTSHSPLPVPPTFNILFCVSMSLMTLDTSHKWSHTVFVFLNWLISFCLASLRFIHVVVYVRISSLFKAEWYYTVCA
jgi:hypothetical protein